MEDSSTKGLSDRWIQFFVIDGPGIRVFTFERDIFQKILKIRIAFPGEIYLRLPFWFIRKVESFQLSTKFRFLTT